MRPPVDVVVPFCGTGLELARTRERLGRLRLGSHDTLTIVDNCGRAGAIGPPVIRADEVRSSYHARNAGAAAGRAGWLVFLDADVIPRPDLLDRYFDPMPAETTGLIAGGIVDEHHAGRGSALRYAALKQSMSHDTVLGRGRWSFAQTANCAVRRSAFEAVGGFVPDIRSGGDADLAFRLKREGWAMEVRAGAEIVHLNRQTWRGLLSQRAKHGSGAAWLERRYPGAFPRRRWLGLMGWSISSWGRAAAFLLRRDTGAALVAVADPVAVWAFEIGRLRSNQVPAPRPG